MGERGANIQKVCSDFNVQIKIPDRKSSKAQPNGITNGQDEDTNGHDNSDIIRISGRKENCEDAAAALNALVPINIEVTLLEYLIIKSDFNDKSILSIILLSINLAITGRSTI